MPPLWKKAKRIGRISLLVSKLRSKHSQSLPVETGFPTSVADLIVKNRDRLKKSPKPQSEKKISPKSPSLASSSVSDTSERHRSQSVPPLPPIERRLSEPSSTIHEISVQGSEKASLTEKPKELLRLPPLTRGSSAGLLLETLSLERENLLESEIVLDTHYPPRPTGNGKYTNSVRLPPLARKFSSATSQSPSPASSSSSHVIPEASSSTQYSLRKSFLPTSLNALPSLASSISIPQRSYTAEGARELSSLQSKSSSCLGSVISQQRASRRYPLAFLILGLAFGTTRIALVLTISAIFFILIDKAKIYALFFCKHGENLCREFATGFGGNRLNPKDEIRSVGDAVPGVQSQTTAAATSSSSQASMTMKISDLIEADVSTVSNDGSSGLRARFQKKFVLKKRGKVCKIEDALSVQNDRLPDFKEGEEINELEDENRVMVEGEALASKICGKRSDMVSVVYVLLLLSGLAGGYITAIALSVIWCLLVKSFEVIRAKFSTREQAI